jgi:hypothetical protein
MEGLAEEQLVGERGRPQTAGAHQRVDVIGAFGAPEVLRRARQLRPVPGDERKVGLVGARGGDATAPVLLVDGGRRRGAKGAHVELRGVARVQGRGREHRVSALGEAHHRGATVGGDVEVARQAKGSANGVEDALALLFFRQVGVQPLGAEPGVVGRDADGAAGAKQAREASAADGVRDAARVLEAHGAMGVDHDGEAALGRLHPEGDVDRSGAGAPVGGVLQGEHAVAVVDDHPRAEPALDVSERIVADHGERLQAAGLGAAGLDEHRLLELGPRVGVLMGRLLSLGRDAGRAGHQGREHQRGDHQGGRQEAKRHRRQASSIA